MLSRTSRNSFKTTPPNFSIGRHFGLVRAFATSAKVSQTQIEAAQEDQQLSHVISLESFLAAGPTRCSWMPLFKREREFPKCENNDPLEDRPKLGDVPEERRVPAQIG